MKDNKQAKFFCEFCGSEVPRKAKTCPKCGKFFASVMCPKCAHTGTTEEFKNGCPKCGYAVPGNNAKKKNSNIQFYNAISMNKNPQYYNSSDINTKNKGKKMRTESSLPFWVYAVVVLTLVILVVMLYSCL